MDWDCWSRAFSAIYGDPSDAKRELKEFHHWVVATRLVLVSHDSSVRVSRERESSAPEEPRGLPRRRPPTLPLH
jgi:hypothetical protein